MLDCGVCQWEGRATVECLQSHSTLSMQTRVLDREESREVRRIRQHSGSAKQDICQTISTNDSNDGVCYWDSSHTHSSIHTRTVCCVVELMCIMCGIIMCLFRRFIIKIIIAQTINGWPQNVEISIDDLSPSYTGTLQQLVVRTTFPLISIKIRRGCGACGRPGCVRYN